MEALIALIIIALTVIYFGKFLKTNIDIATDMAEDELLQARSSQTVRHAKTNSKRTAEVEEIFKSNYLSARDIINMTTTSVRKDSKDDENNQ